MIEKESLDQYIEELHSKFNDFCPALIFDLSRHVSFFNHELEKWELGLIDWEESLKLIIESTENHIKKISIQSGEIKYKDSDLIPVLEKTLMPDLDKESDPLVRQNELIKSCYLVAKIHQDYYDLLLNRMESRKSFIIPFQSIVESNKIKADKRCEKCHYFDIETWDNNIYWHEGLFNDFYPCDSTDRKARELIDSIECNLTKESTNIANQCPSFKE